MEQQIDPLYLYPMPRNLLDKNEHLKLEADFVATQKAILKKAYRNSLDAYAKKLIMEFNAVLPAAHDRTENRNTYFNYTDAAKKHRKSDVKKVFGSDHAAEHYVLALKERGFRHGYIGILNKTVSGMDRLSCFRNLNTHDSLIKIIESRIRNAKLRLTEIQIKLDDGKFSFEDYCTLVDDYSFQYFAKDFFDATKRKISEKIDAAKDLSELDTYDFELVDFCSNNELPSPEEYLHTFSVIDNSNLVEENQVFFNSELIGLIASEPQYGIATARAMRQIVNDNLSGVVLNPENVSIYLMGDDEFEVYFQNDNLRVISDSVYLRKHKAFAIIDDRTKKDFDLLFCVDGVTPVYKNVIRDTVEYRAIVYAANGKKSQLLLGYPDIYSNKDVDIVAIKGIVDKIDEYLRSLN